MKRLVHLKDVAMLLNGRAYKQDELLNAGKYPVLRVGNFFSNKEWYYSDLELEEDKYCDNGDLLFAWSASFGPKIWHSGKAIFHYHIWKIVTTDQINKKYLYYYLENAAEKIKAGGRGITMIHTTKSEMEQMELQLPVMEKQLQIANSLDKISSLVEYRKQQLEKLDELVKARFVEMFGDPVQNQLGWKKDLLKNTTSKIGSGATPKGGKESYQSEGITLIRSMNVHDGRFEYKELAHITDEQAKQLENVAVEENDVFINITGASVARSCVVPQHVLPARVNQHVAIIRCVASILNPVFTNNMFLNSSFKEHLLAIGESGGATRQAITKQQLEMLEIILPPIELQEQYAIFVEQTNKSKVEIKKSLEQLEMLKKALMQKYFG